MVWLDRRKLNIVLVPVLAGLSLCAGLTGARADAAKDVTANDATVKETTQQQTPRSEPMKIRVRQRRTVFDLNDGMAYESPVGAFAVVPNLDTESRGLGMTTEWRQRWTALGHGFRLRAGQDNTFDLDTQPTPQHGFSVGAGVESLVTLPSAGLAADIDVGYRQFDLTVNGNDESRARVTVRSLAGTDWDTRTEFSVRQHTPPDSTENENHSNVLLQINRVIGADGLSVGLRQNLHLGLSETVGDDFSSGFQLGYGRHRVGFQHEIRFGPLETEASDRTGLSYAWQGDRIGLSLGADYTTATQDTPSELFAGIAVTLGIDVPGTVAFLDSIR